MKRLRLDGEAEVELRDAIAWYEHERSGLGQELWDEVQESFRLISQRPAIGAFVLRVRIRPPVRRVPLRRFPYFIVYRERDTYVEVIAVAHQSRRPGYWRSRGR